MHIKKVIIKDFRCFEHLEVNLDPEINIFVGNNGSGKSALLDAIAAAIFPYVAQFQYMADKKYREPVPVLQRDLPVKQKNVNSETKIEFILSATGFPDWIINYSKLTTNEDQDRLGFPYSSAVSSLTDAYFNLRNEISELSVVAYYRGDRHLTNINDINDIKNIPNKSFDRFDALKNALNATANFTDLANWFFVREFQELRKGKNQGDINFELRDLKQVRNAISTIISPDTRVYFSHNTSFKLMVEWKMETGEKKEVLLSQLSSGYRNMLALVMDFARRLAQANPQMENPLAAEAILMIDELDLHLHPTWQQQIIPDLRKVFPNTQIIATTHSPEVVTTVNRHQVWILEKYQIKECPSPTKGMKSSDIVTEVLGLLNLRPDTEESRTLKKLFEAIDNGQLEEAQQLRKALQDWESFDSDMTRADMQIRRLERRGKL